MCLQPTIITTQHAMAALRSWLANFGRDPDDERKIAAIVEKLRADGAEADFRSAEDAERAVASAAAADDARRAARPARRTPARRAPATPPPTKRAKVKREGGPRRSVRKVATYNERLHEAAATTRSSPRETLCVCERARSAVIRQGGCKQ